MDTQTPDLQTQINNVARDVDNIKNAVNLLTASFPQVAPQQIAAAAVPAKAQPTFVKAAELEAVGAFDFLKGRKTYLVAFLAPFVNVAIQWYTTGKIDPSVTDVYVTFSAALAALRAAIAKLEA